MNTFYDKLKDTHNKAYMSKPVEVFEPAEDTSISFDSHGSDRLKIEKDQCPCVNH